MHILKSRQSITDLISIYISEQNLSPNFHSTDLWHEGDCREALSEQTPQNPLPILIDPPLRGKDSQDRIRHFYRVQHSIKVSKLRDVEGYSLLKARDTTNAKDQI